MFVDAAVDTESDMVSELLLGEKDEDDNDDTDDTVWSVLLVDEHADAQFRIKFNWDFLFSIRLLVAVFISISSD